MYCPRCKYEYRDDFIICFDCNTELINSLQEKIQEIPKVKKVRTSIFNYIKRTAEGAKVVLKIHMLVCVLSLLLIGFSGVISSYYIIIFGTCVYLASGFIILKKRIKTLSLFIIFGCVLLLEAVNILLFYIIGLKFTVIQNMTVFLMFLFADPMQILNLLTINPLLTLICMLVLSIIPVFLMLIGKGLLKCICPYKHLFEKLIINMVIIKRVLICIFIVLLTANLYLVYNPKISVVYDNSVGFHGFDEKINISESGEYNYLKTLYYSSEQEEVKLKLSKNEMRYLVLNTIYINNFFSLNTDLSVYSRTDQPGKAIKIKWLGRTKDVHGYGIENLRFRYTSSVIEEKIKRYFENQAIN